MKKRWLLFPAFLLCIPVAASLVLGWIAAGWMVSPPRRALAPFHTEWIEHAYLHGIRIRTDHTLSGVPYLLCEPNRAAGLSPRGSAIRNQLAERGVGLPAFGQIRGTLVLLHGRGMRKEDLILTAERFCAVGFRCLIPDLPAHGDNPEGRLCFGGSRSEQNLARDVLACASERYQFPARPAGLWGMSLGGAFAIAAASEDPKRWDAVVLVSTFDELAPIVQEEAGRLFPGFAPVATLGLPCAVRYRGGYFPSSIRPVERARALTMPVMIVHGTQDSLIGLQHGRRIYEAIPHTHKRLVQVTEADHGNVLTTPQLVFCEMAAWYLEAMRPATPVLRGT